MTRIAWFAPLPPVRSGIARYNVELLPSLAGRYEIDLFVAGHPGRVMPPHAGARVSDAHDFVWKHHRNPYDLIVYQLGNAPCHDYMWPYLVRYPGMVVLHDGQLHHARARALLQRKRPDDYRAELRFSHPDADADIAELGIEGLLGSLTYLWPMLRVVVDSARMIVVHNAWLAEQLREAHPAATVEVIEMGVPEPKPRNEPSAVRARYGIAADTVVFTAFGRVTPEKRIGQAIRALSAARARAVDVRLVLVGEVAGYYDPHADARAAGVEELVTVTGYVDDQEIDDYLAASDVCLCMRWPTSRETSASWLRCIAAGRPTVTTDLIHTYDLPMLDPRTWALHQAPAASFAARDTVQPVGVSVDILDEEHSLTLAMRRLASDARLRLQLGRAARELWQARFRLEQMASRYSEVIDQALITPASGEHERAALPAHLLVDGTEHTAELLARAGLAGALRSDLWIGQR